MSHESILLVDDNPENLMLLELLLGCEDFTVQTATSAQEALAALASRVPDAMLTDIQMPDVDGLELIRQVRRDPRTRGIRILAVSANAMKEDVEQAYAAGCDGYITKPMDTRTFAATVRGQVEGGAGAHGARPKSATLGEEDFLPGAELLRECTRKIEDLVSHRSGSLRREQSGEVLNQCAGMAGVLGFPHVSSLARDLETRSAALSEEEFVEGLRRLAESLANVRAAALKI